MVLSRRLTQQFWSAKLSIPFSLSGLFGLAFKRDCITTLALKTVISLERLSNLPCTGYLGHLLRNRVHWEQLSQQSGQSKSERMTEIDMIIHQICSSGNDFILPVIPVQGFQQQFWERLKFKLISCIRAWIETVLVTTLFPVYISV